MPNDPAQSRLTSKGSLCPNCGPGAEAGEHGECRSCGAKVTDMAVRLCCSCRFYAEFGYCERYHEPKRPQGFCDLWLPPADPAERPILTASQLSKIVFFTVGLCQCGQPASVIERMSDILALSDEQVPSYVERRGALLGGDKSPKAWLWLYVLDRAGLLEHGGNCWSSWITPLGEETLRAIGRFGGDPQAWEDAQQLPVCDCAAPGAQTKPEGTKADE